MPQPQTRPGPFGMPQPQQGGLGALMNSPLLMAGLGMLSANTPSTQPVNPISGLLQGLMAGNQMQGQQRDRQMQELLYQAQLAKAMRPEKQKETDAMANVTAAGYVPGTPEFQEQIKSILAGKDASEANPLAKIDPKDSPKDSFAKYAASDYKDYSVLEAIPQRGQTTYGTFGTQYNAGSPDNPKWMERVYGSDGSYQDRPLGGIPQRALGYDPATAGAVAGEKAENTETGKSLGEAKSLLADMEANMPKLTQVATDLSKLGKAASYTGLQRGRDFFKREMGVDVGDPAVARTEYIAKVDNEILPLLRQTFGAQFTEKEGQALKVTLGDPNKSPEEKDAVLRTFIQAKEGQIAALKQRVAPASNIDDLLNKYK